MKFLLWLILRLALSAMIFLSLSCKKKDTGPALGNTKLLIDDLEGNIKADSSFGNGAKCHVSFIDKDSFPLDVYKGTQSMKITYEKNFGGYLYSARGFGLKPVKDIAPKKLIWTIEPENIDFKKYNAFGFFLKGNKTGHFIAVDLLDKDREIFRYVLKDDSDMWREIIILFSEFKSREDYQPNWNKRNKTIDFPVLTYQFEPLADKDEVVKGHIIIDAVHFDTIKASPLNPEKEESTSSKVPLEEQVP